MTKKNFHSVPWNGDWAVKEEKKIDPLSIHKTQATAEAKTRQLAKKAKVEAVFHRKNGTIKDKDSFGNDPMPPRDRRF